jgi:hypothetical protein
VEHPISRPISGAEHPISGAISGAEHPICVVRLDRLASPRKRLFERQPVKERAYL